VRRHLAEDRGQPHQRIESDAWWPQIHPRADRRVDHPARQLAQPAGLILDQDDVDPSATCAFAQTKPPAEQRVPAISDGREYRFVC
jgi:hypothetical protein